MGIAAPSLLTVRRHILRKLVELAAKIDLGDRLGVAWQGSKAHHVSKGGSHGFVPHSELAMHVGIAGNPIKRYALFKHEGNVNWANVETVDKVGKIRHTEGLPSEVLSWPVRMRHKIHLSSLERPILFDDRRRNDMGQYVANETEGVDPNSMAAAYGPPAVQPVNPMSESHLDRIKRFFAGRRTNQSASVGPTA